MDGRGHLRTLTSTARMIGVKIGKKTFFIILIAFLLTVISGVIYLGHELKESMSDVTDPARYTAVLARLGYPKPTILDIPSIGFLPPQIPANATNVRFFYRQGWQGGTQFRLRFVLPPADLNVVLQKAKAAAIGEESGSKDGFESPPGAPAPDLLDVALMNYVPLPDDFEVFLLDAKNMGTSPTTQSDAVWLEGYTGGIAVSQKRGEVVYWVEEWQ
jgi:hypothetical protein